MTPQPSLMPLLLTWLVAVPGCASGTVAERTDGAWLCAREYGGAICHCSRTHSPGSGWPTVTGDPEPLGSGLEPVADCRDYPCCFRDLESGDCFCVVMTTATDPNASPQPDCRRVPVVDAEPTRACPPRMEWL